MIGGSLSVIEIQALIILKTFATHILPAQVVGLPKAICNFIGIAPSGMLVGIKLEQSVTTPLTIREARARLEPEFHHMKSFRDRGPVRLELWVSLNKGSWQFFEITEEGVREVEHACQP